MRYEQLMFANKVMVKNGKVILPEAKGEITQEGRVLAASLGVNLAGMGYALDTRAMDTLARLSKIWRPYGAP